MRTFLTKVAVGLAGALVLTSVSGAAQATSAADPVDPPTAIGTSVAEVSVAVRDLPARSPQALASGTVSPRINPEPQRRGEAGPTSEARSRRLPKAKAPALGNSPAPDLVFDGTGNPLGCGGCTPPDTTGDVGPSHYIQMVNATKVAIFDKAGVLQVPAFNLSDLFTSGVCSTADRGDPQVVYDPLADRWVLSQFQNAPNTLCFAVSQTADPLGSYYLYDFLTPEFPDYFKLGVWPSGYYVSSNEASYTAYAFDRQKMLLGQPATSIRVPGETNFMLPADVDGTGLPSAAGGLFYTFKDNLYHGGQDRLEMFEFTPDFTTPGNTTFTTIATFPIAPFTYTVCGFFVLDCVPQGGTSQKVDPVSEWPMQRFAYRRLADRETLVGNFTIGDGSGPAGAAIRWFELDNTGSGWVLGQEGTHDLGDGLDRWMGSIAMDAAGNIALGYSASSAAEFPSLRYATRTPTDPPGTLQAEQVMQSGGGSQTGSNRWGDYTAMSVDPADEQAFWYTGQYYAVTSARDWSTAIGTFRVPWPQVLSFPQPPDVSLGAGSVTVSATGGGSGNPVLFTSASPGVCTTSGVDGATVMLVAAGTCTLSANQAGNANYSAAAQVQRSFQVTQSAQVITFPQPPDVSLGVGSVAVSATGGGSGNPVVFTSASPGVCTTSGADGSTVTLVAAGTCTLSANQAGNANYSAAAQVQRSFQVTQSAQVITFPQPPDVSLGVGSVAVSATGGGSGNPVVFTSASPGVCTTSGADGSTVTLVAAGTCTLSANQAGNATYSAAAQVQRSFQVTPGAPIRQRPLDNCVVVPRQIPLRGTTKLMDKNCITNAGQNVRVAVAGSVVGSRGALGEVRYWTVIRKANGAVFLRTRGYPLRLRIRWFAPAVDNYLAYTRIERYRTSTPQ